MNTYAKTGEGGLGIYIQVPFCQTKCTYCNFHTGVASPAAYAPYARAVEREIRDWRALHAAAGLQSVNRLPLGNAAPISCHSERSEESAFALNVAPGCPEQPVTGVVERKKGGSARKSHGHQELSRDNKDNTALFAPKQVDTVYLGGGTPSLFDPADLARILAAMHSQFPGADPIAPSPTARAASAEVTLEADPETITPEKAAAWLASGINRISLGAQSFHDAELKPAGRMHRREDIFTAISHLRAAGFANISLDLIAGLPHQTAASWQASLVEALRLRPEHISIYLFEVDEGSHLGRELLSGGSRYSAAAVPSDDATVDSYEFACDRLREAGYDHYEISNWALPGFRSRHNLKYWRREPYLGFGAGAHSFDGRWRWANAHDPAAYAAAIEQGRLPLEQLEEVTPKLALEEELFLGLRQLEGIDLACIEAQHGAEFSAGFKETLGVRLDELRAQGLVERAGTRVRLAPARLAISNEVFVALLD
jgi:oxygen-independent coproporphyrinogen III oxidase